MVLETLVTKLFGLNWRDKVQPASFRGVPFYVSSTDTGLGRRNIVHQYPFREEPYVEDIGQDADEFTINGYVIANKSNDYDYFKQRDQLMKALRTKGSGILVHPYHGDKEVSLVGKARLSESFDEGGIARFTMTFVTSGVNRYPVKDMDNISALDNQVSDTESIAQDSLGSKWSIAGLTGTSLSNIASTVRKCYAAQRKIMAAIQGGPRSLISAGLGYVDSSAANLFDSTISNACNLGSNLLSSFNAFKNIGGIVGDFQDNILTGVCSGMITKRKTGVNRGSTAKAGTIDSELGASIILNLITIATIKEEINLPTVTSPTSAQESANQEMLLNFIVNIGMTAASQIAVRIDYKSHSDATLIMNAVNDVIDSQLDDIGNNANFSKYIVYGINFQDDESYMAMQDLRRIFTSSMQNIAANLPQLINYEVPYVVTPAIILAYNKYKDLDRESDIITRNQILIPHPGFLPGGETISILSY